MNTKVRHVLNRINESFLAAATEEYREPMAAYMKNQFVFYGVKSPARKDILRVVKPLLKELNGEEILILVEALWQVDERESQYLGMDILGFKNKYWDVAHLPRIEKLIVTKSWWDTVDALAPNIAGAIFRKDEKVRMTWIEKWNNSENMWLNRSALIHQLRYKEEVHLDLLFALVSSHIGSREFFINKASGWALRQASKYYPAKIKIFIENHPLLSNLTKREGTKYL